MNDDNTRPTGRQLSIIDTSWTDLKKNMIEADPSLTENLLDTGIRKLQNALMKQTNNKKQIYFFAQYLDEKTLSHLFYYETVELLAALVKVEATPNTSLYIKEGSFKIPKAQNIMQHYAAILETLNTGKSAMYNKNILSQYNAFYDTQIASILTVQFKETFEQLLLAFEEKSVPVGELLLRILPILEDELISILESKDYVKQLNKKLPTHINDNKVPKLNTWLKKDKSHLSLDQAIVLEIITHNLFGDYLFESNTDRILDLTFMHEKERLKRVYDVSSRRKELIEGFQAIPFNAEKIADYEAQIDAYIESILSTARTKFALETWELHSVDYPSVKEILATPIQQALTPDDIQQIYQYLLNMVLQIKPTSTNFKQENIARLNNIRERNTPKQKNASAYDQLSLLTTPEKEAFSKKLKQEKIQHIETAIALKNSELSALQKDLDDAKAENEEILFSDYQEGIYAAYHFFQQDSSSKYDSVLDSLIGIYWSEIEK
ncbi:hypothetical protein [Listeria booriae]|uniref:Uncharacterized protein n=2 Tax=Listeria booriae TaxID=1552123 RepID=A0A7X0TMD7_9LIST|nr:hypothetical protein [Listeria booriae]MBC1331855.1 hypothetical protein [Listeria booriae]MBC2387632.1 hypothetical protein [Listeria booriae]